MKASQYFILILLAWVTTSCSSSTTPQVPDAPQVPQKPLEAEVAIAFMPASGRNSASRATTYIPLEDEYSNFGVYAQKKISGAYQDVLNREGGTPTSTKPYEVCVNVSDQWYYENISYGSGQRQYLRFWDNAAEQYTFSAYAPYLIGSDPATDTYPITVTAESISIAGVKGNISIGGANPDWVVARHLRTNGSSVGDFDLMSASPTVAFNEPSLLYEEVPLIFHHIMSLIEIKAYTSDGYIATADNVKIDFVGTDITTKADYSTTGWTNDSDLTTTLCNISGPIEFGAENISPSTAVDIASKVEIPQDVKNKKIHITLTLDDGSKIEGEFALPENWESEKKYIYYIVFSGEKQYILVDVQVDDFLWSEGTDIDIEDDVTNW